MTIICFVLMYYTISSTYYHREGSYCATPGLPSVSGSCDPGYYCARGASRSDPTDGITGDICPPGRYCGTYGK